MKSLRKYASLATILMMFFIDFVGIGLVYPMFPPMIFGHGSTLLAANTSAIVRGIWLGLILALMPLAQFFSGPVLGTLSDRKGRKKLILTSITSSALGYAVAVVGVLHANILLIALSRVVIGIAAGNEAVGSAAIADISTPENKAKHFGLVHMAAGFGLTLGPFLGGYLSTLHIGRFSGFAVPFVVACVLSVVNLIAVMVLFKETHTPSGQQSTLSFGLKNIKRAWCLPGFFVLFVAIFFYNFGWSFYWDFVPTYWLETFNYNAIMVSRLYAWGAAWYALSAGLLIRPIVNRFKTETILYWALIVSTILIALPLIFPAEWLYWIILPTQEYTISLIFPATSAIVSNRCSEAMQGEIMGILQSVQSLALIVSPLAAGCILGISVKLPIIIGAGTFALAAYIFRCAQNENA